MIGNTIGDRGAFLLSDVLKNNNTVKSLSLSGWY